MGPKPSSSQASAPGEEASAPGEVDMVEPHLEDVDIKSIKAEPEPSGSGSGAGGGAMVEADLGDESYGAGGADGDDNGDFGAEGEFEGFDQYGDGSEFDDSMGAAGGSGAAADGKGVPSRQQHMELAKFVQTKYGNILLYSAGYVYGRNASNGNKTYWQCRNKDKEERCLARA